MNHICPNKIHRFGLRAGNSRFLFHDLMRSVKLYGYLIVEGVRGLF